MTKVRALSLFMLAVLLLAELALFDGLGVLDELSQLWKAIIVAGVTVGTGVSVLFAAIGRRKD